MITKERGHPCKGIRQPVPRTAGEMEIPSTGVEPCQMTKELHRMYGMPPFQFDSTHTASSCTAGLCRWNLDPRGTLSSSEAARFPALSSG